MADFSIFEIFQKNNSVMYLSFYFAMSVIGLFSMLLIARSQSFLKKFLYVPARKSTTNAIQLGGLPVAFVLTSFVLGLTFTDFVDLGLYGLQKKVIKYWSLCSGILIAYGYLDDKYELRPIVKLIMQFTTITVFSVMASHIAYAKFSSLAFVVLFVVGMGVLNGSNLLDGLDTLTVKLGLVTMGTFSVIAVNFSLPNILFLSAMGILALASFYFFNKEPAKIHLGEIGGSFVGFYSLLLACLTFMEFQDARVHSYHGFGIVMFALTLPMVELGVSFLRRIYNRKSPFKGDKYHVHHILRNYHGHGPSAVANIMSFSYMCSIALTFTVTHWLGGIWGFFTLTASLISLYVAVGRKYWKSDDHIDLNPTSLFSYLQKKNVTVINSGHVDDFEIIFLETEGDVAESEYERMEDDLEDEKKAA